jgi:molybdopterin-binding protein
MKISARNQIPGTIVSLAPGAVNATVKVDVGGAIVMIPAAIEEFLRLYAPYRVFARTADHDIEMSGRMIPEQRRGCAALSFGKP